MLPRWLGVEKPPVNARDAGDTGLIPRLGRAPGEGNGNSLTYSCLEKSHGQRSLAGHSPWGRKSWTLLSDLACKRTNIDCYFMFCVCVCACVCVCVCVCVWVWREGSYNKYYQWLPFCDWIEGSFYFLPHFHPWFLHCTFSSVQFSRSVWLCNPMDCSTPGLPVHHQFLEFTQIHIHWVGDAIQPSPLLSPSPPAFNLSQHYSLFQRVSSLHQVANVLEFQLQHQSFQWIFRTEFL